MGAFSESRAVVREAALADAARIASTLHRAFADDPVQRFLFPGERDYQRRGLPNFELVVRRTLEVGAVYAADDLAGASLWVPPEGDLLAGWHGKWFGLRSLRWIGSGLGRGNRLFRELARHHPREPHWYLPVLGTTPERQGRGLGSAVLAPVLARCDAEGVPAYLESSKERNVPFYRKHGFEVTGSIRVPDGPELWPMWREPKRAP